MGGVNLFAVFVAAAASFLLGGPWYSARLFGNAWNRANGSGSKKEKGEGGHPAKVFGFSLLFALIAAFAFAVWLGPAPPLGFAVSRGLTAGACFVATSFGINYQFANRSPVLWLIDGGYHTVQFMLFGLVLGLWH